MDKIYSCDETKKWSCSACTYLNWPKALRCTQCETARDKKFNLNEYETPDSRHHNSSECITDILENLKLSQQDEVHDGYRRKRNENEHGRALNNSPVDNYFESDYMTSPQQQIHNLRSPSFDSQSKKYIHPGESKNEKSPIICQSLDGPYGNKSSAFNFDRAAETDYSLNSFGAYGSKNISPSLVTNSKNSSKSSYGSGSGAALSGDPNATNSDKWTCHICTYDNWPRAGKCVMCLTARGRPGSVPRVTSIEEIDSSRSSFGSQGSGTAPTNNRALLGNEVTVTGNNRVSNSASNHVISSGVPNNRRSREVDSRWLEACRGVVEGNIVPVEEYLAAGGDPSRQLTSSEVTILARPSAFDAGFTLVHLALRFHQEHLLATLLSQVDGGPPVVKRVPSYAAPDLAADIRRNFLSSIRKRKGSFHCQYTTEIATFTLPSEIEDYAAGLQETVFDEVLDRDVQKELDNGQIINWSPELMEQLNSRLYALWNRSAGDCLLDSVLQATWGIFDRENGLRQAVADSLHACATMFYQRWKENESLNARLLSFSLNDSQCAADWAKLLSIASKPGSSLEQLHIFALTHILRRPIIVYGVKYVKSFRGETLGFAKYEGLYLPFFWEATFCWKSPICLGYTRGHFSALVTMDPDCDPLSSVATAAQLGPDDINDRSAYLPLTSVDGNLLPIHFLTQSEIGKEEMIMNQWLDVRYTDTGIMMARQRIQKPPLLVAQMLEEWLNHYRRLRQVGSGPYLRQPTGAIYSSDGDSDD